VERITIPFENKQIVGYLRLPEGLAKAPLVFFWGGVDSWKEDENELIAGFLDRGWGCFVFDIPGTGESPIRSGPDANRVFSAVLDHLETRPEIDAKRIAAMGISFGGYWAVKMAYVEHRRIRAAVNWGGGVHLYFQPEWQHKTLQESEYLMDWFEAQATPFGIDSLEDYLEAASKMSLQRQGILENPSAPLLIVQGKKDSLIPISDTYLLMEKGTPKTAWVHPEGIHLGRGPGFTNHYIRDKVILPWLDIHLSGAL
jgi:pimeloyl-ACP methyl ester carboxylesterase